MEWFSKKKWFSKELHGLVNKNNDLVQNWMIEALPDRRNNRARETEPTPYEKPMQMTKDVNIYEIS